MKAMHRWQVDLAEKWFPSLGIPVTRVWTTPAALPKDARPEENLAEIMKKAGKLGCLYLFLPPAPLDCRPRPSLHSGAGDLPLHGGDGQVGLRERHVPPDHV